MSFGVIERYRAYLPVSSKTPVITLHEGSTPLIPARHLASFLKIEADIFFKFEGLNPTGSFKDRGMTLAVSLAVERGAQAVLCASTGNTSASAAAYAARAGIRCAVLIPGGAIALGKLAQALMYGATVVSIKGNFDQALTLVRQISEKHPIALVNSVNPDRIEGQKTGAFEVIDDLGKAPDIHCIPVGNAGNITAYWKGYREYQQAKKSSSLPMMWGFQASGAAPLVLGHVVENPHTIATAIKIGNPASADGARAAVKESSGLIQDVTDEEITEAYRYLAEHEGLFAEPASAASVAGLIKRARNGQVPSGKTIVCVLTGHGLKDPGYATEGHQIPDAVDPNLSSVLKAIGL